MPFLSSIIKKMTMSIRTNKTILMIKYMIALPTKEADEEVEEPIKDRIEATAVMVIALTSTLR
jgi:phosphoenolpyruvate carboxylase